MGAMVAATAKFVDSKKGADQSITEYVAATLANAFAVRNTGS